MRPAPRRTPKGCLSSRRKLQPWDPMEAPVAHDPGRLADLTQGGDPQPQEWVLPCVVGAKDLHLPRDGPPPDDDRGPRISV